MVQKALAPVKSFAGLHTRSDPSEIEDNQLVACKNYNLSLAGSIKSRKGLENVLTTSGLTTILGVFIKASTEYLIFKDTTGIRYTTDLVSSTLISNTPSNPVMGIQYADEFYVLDDTDGLYKWDGTTFSAIASTPAANMGIVHKDRLFLVNQNGSNPSRLYFSDPGDFTSFPGTNFIDVDPGDGDFLTDLAILYDLLIIFKAKTTWSLSVQGDSESDWVLRRINSNLGCTSRRVAKDIEGTLFFIDARGIYRTDGTTFREISTLIADQFNDRSIDDVFDDADYLAWWEDLIITHITRDSDVKLFVFHTKAGGWTEWEFPETITGFQEVYSSGLGKGLYIGATGKIFRYSSEIYLDNGAEFNTSLKTKSFDFDIPTQLKRGFWIGLDALVTKNSTFNSIIDNGAVTKDQNVLLEPSRRVFKLAGPEYFRHWQANFESQGQNEIFSIILTVSIKSKISGIRV